MLSGLSLSSTGAASSVAANDSDDDPAAMQEGISDYVPFLAPAPAPAATIPIPGTSKDKRRKKKKKQQQQHQPKPKPNSKYANQCMYAELLELHEEPQWTVDSNGELVEDPEMDGLPSGLETQWVALAPIPAGKRCIAVSQTQHSGQSKLAPLHRLPELKLTQKGCSLNDAHPTPFPSQRCHDTQIPFPTPT